MINNNMAERQEPKFASASFAHADLPEAVCMDNETSTAADSLGKRESSPFKASDQLTASYYSTYTSVEHKRDVIDAPSASSRPVHTESRVMRSSAGPHLRPENLSFKDQVRVSPLDSRRDPQPLISSSHIQVEAVASPLETSGSMMDVSRKPDAVLALVTEGFPVGLAQQLVEAKESFPLRLWVVDNSGSMMQPDCIRPVPAAQEGKMTLTKCTRWNEMQNVVESHAHLAGILKFTTIFRLLNKPGAKGALQDFTINSSSDVELAKNVMSITQPEGVTPITARLLEIRERIRAVEHDMVANGHKSVIVIATDGLPSDEYGDSPDAVKREFCDVLKSLQLLPVWTVIRLFTNERSVRNFYNKLDKELEIPVDCISSYMNEAKEIQKWNGWLNYGMPLQQCREMGFHRRVFDLLDERTLTKDELLEVLELIFGKASLENAPSVHADWKGFVAWVANVCSKEGRQWNPLSRKMECWIDIRKLDMTYGGGLIGSIRRKVSDLVL